MHRRTPKMLVAGLFLIVSGMTAGATDQKETDAPQDIRVSGYTEFVHSCAACHGLDGTGDGPLASALRTEPPDLTGIAARNGGIFPHVWVNQMIASGGGLKSHGAGEMPIWGERFRSYLSPELTDELIHNLTRHLEGIQR